MRITSGFLLAGVLALVAARLLRPSPSLVVAPARGAVAETASVRPGPGRDSRTRDFPRATPAPPATETLPENTSQSARRWLISTQNEDGSWGSNAEEFEGGIYDRHSATSLAILAWVGDGFTHCSREMIGDRKTGDSVKAGLKWLLENPPEGSMDTALVTLALAEAYGTTNAQILKEPVEKSLADLLALQSENGAWGDDPRSSTWAAMALKSVSISGIDVAEEPVSRAEGWFAQRLLNDSQPGDAVGWWYSTKDRHSTLTDRTLEVVGSQPPDWSHQEFERWYLGMHVVLDFDGRSGPLTRTWAKALNRTLLLYQDRDGGWAGTERGTRATVKNSLGLLTIQTLGRYREIFADAKRK